MSEGAQKKLTVNATVHVPFSFSFGRSSSSVSNLNGSSATGCNKIKNKNTVNNKPWINIYFVHILIGQNKSQENGS